MAEPLMSFFSPIDPFANTQIGNQLEVSHGIVLLQQDGMIRTCNSVLQSWLGIPMREVTGQYISTFLPGLTLPGLSAEAGFSFRAKPDGEGCSKKMALHRPDGEYVAVIVNVDALMLDDERLYIGVLNYDQGRHSRKRSMEDFMFSAMLTDEAVAITDSGNRVEFVNDSFEAMTGFCRDELIGRKLNDLLVESDVSNFKPYRSKEAGSHKNRKRISMHRKKDGTTFFFLQTARDFVDADGVVSHTIVEGRDISAAVAAHNHLNYLANFDGLTGLPSRMRALDNLQKTIVQASLEGDVFSIAIVDVDDFKRINDCYGHAVGDIVLRNVADRIKSALGESDSVSRLSGDEFLIVMPNTDSSCDAEDKVKKIHEEFSRGFSVKEVGVPISVSIGTAFYPSNGNNMKSLMEYADFAMYRAKYKREPYARSGRRSRRTFKILGGSKVNNRD